jgi:hypothetical protein
MEVVKEAPRQTIKRGLDEPKLEIGDTITTREGVVGVVLARYAPSGKPNQVCYIVEILSNGEEKETRAALDYNEASVSHQNRGGI